MRLQSRITLVNLSRRVLVWNTESEEYLLIKSLVCPGKLIFHPLSNMRSRADRNSMKYPVDDLVKLCKKYGVMSMVDAAHAIGQVKVDIKALDPDFWVSVSSGCPQVIWETRFLIKN